MLKLFEFKGGSYVDPKTRQDLDKMMSYIRNMDASAKKFKSFHKLKEKDA